MRLPARRWATIATNGGRTGHRTALCSYHSLCCCCSQFSVPAPGWRPHFGDFGVRARGHIITTYRLHSLHRPRATERRARTVLLTLQHF